MVGRSIHNYFLIFHIIFWTCASAMAQNSSGPNIILILTDDLGWSCLSAKMDETIAHSASEYHHTPNINKLAAQGMRFTRGYASASICSPSRRSILFGQTPIRQGDEDFKEKYNAQRSDLLSIPQVLKGIDRRYKAAHFGKWDIRADIFPEDVGYDESDGNTGNSDGNVMTDKVDKWIEHFITGDPKRMFTLADRATNFMSRQVLMGNPFYLQISHYAPHVDIQTRQETYDKYISKPKGKKHAEPGWAGMLEDLDSSIGQVLEMVDALGIGNDTYIFFMSDNGAVEFLPPVRNRLDHPSSFDNLMRNYPLRAGKWTLYEGGIRVPFMVKGPGIKAGSQCDVPVAGWDLLPTFSELARNKSVLKGQSDGVSFVELLQNEGHGKMETMTRNLIFHRYNNEYPHSAIIAGHFKVIKFWKSGKLELYNLKNDPGELNDIAKENPEKTTALAKKMMQYIHHVNPGLSLLYN